MGQAKLLQSKMPQQVQVVAFRKQGYRPVPQINVLRNTSTFTNDTMVCTGFGKLEA